MNEIDRNLLKFINGENNVVKIEVVISREKTPQGNEYIHVSSGDTNLYEFWHNPNKSRGTPKNTGGKKPYILLMINKLEEIKKTGVPNVEELIGFLVCLANYIEWNTGRIINKRSKKSLKYIDLQKMFSCGKRKLDKIIKQLKDNDLLYNNTEGYFISTDLIKKGGR